MNHLNLKIAYFLSGFVGFLLFLLGSPIRWASGQAATNSTDIANGVSNGLVNGGSVWLESTMVVALVFITAMAFSLQIARGYFIRVLNKFTLRLGADIWWLAYILIRDALIFMSFIMGLLVFFPGTFLDYPMAVPFMPLSVVFFGAALVTKLYVDADDNRKAFRFVTVLVFIGTLLWISGTIFVTESVLQLSTLPAGVSATSGIWYMMYQTFSSQTNLALTMTSFEVCFALLGVIGVFGFAHPLLHSRLPFKKKPTGLTSSSRTAVGAPSAAPIARVWENASDRAKPSIGNTSSLGGATKKALAKPPLTHQTMEVSGRTASGRDRTREQSRLGQ